MLHSPSLTALPLFLGLLLSAVALPATINAHFGGQATVFVPLEYVDPGQSFPVIGADLGVDAGVTFRLVREDRTVELGRVSAGLDGHLQSTFDLPADFPLGYAELVATSDDGSRASTWILVGPRTDATLAPPNRPAIWQDPAVWLIGGMVAAGLPDNWTRTGATWSAGPDTYPDWALKREGGQLILVKIPGG